MEASVINSVVHPNALQHIEGPLVLARMKGWVVVVGEVSMLSAWSSFRVAYGYKLLL